MTRSPSIRHVVGLAAIAALAVAGPATGTAAPVDDPEPIPPEPTATLTIVRTDVSAAPLVDIEITLPAMLTDGSPSAADVTVLEEGRPVAFELTPVPTERLEVVLLIDTSGSMNDGDAIDSARVAAIGFLDELPADVAVGIVGFSSVPSLVSPLTSDRDQLAAALAVLSATGETALYDAIVFGASLFSGGTSDHQFVLLSDGGDTVSSSTLDDAVAVSAGIRTSAIELVTFESNRAALESIAVAGDGRLVQADDPAALTDLYRDVATTLVNRAQLSFTTQRSGPTEYEVRVVTADGVLTATTSAILPPTAPTTVVPEDPGDEPADTEPADTVPTAPETSVAPLAPTGPPTSGTSDGSGTGGRGTLLVGGAAAVFASLMLLLLSIWPEDDRRRAGRHALGAPRASARPASADGSGIGERISGATDRALERWGRRHGLAQALDVAAVPLRPGEFVVIGVAVAVTAAAVLATITGPIGLVIAAVAVPIGARAVLRIRGDRRRRAFAAQLPDVLQLLTSGLRAGYALPQAIDAVASQAAEPARAEFQRVMFEARVGRDLGDALRAAAERMHSTDFDWVVAAFDINREIGGELAQILENVAETIRERQELDRQVRTLTAEGRISAYVLTALPFVMLLAILLVNPSYLAPMTESPGPQLLVACAVLLVIGWLWMRRLIKARI